MVTYGCQMNLSDSERISAVLEGLKYKPTPEIDEADLVVVNACSVRQSAVDRIYGLAQKLKKNNKKITTILTGCVLKKDKKNIGELFDYVMDIKDIKKLPEIINGKFFASRQKTYQNYLDITPKYSNKFSANVPIMTGCNNFCVKAHMFKRKMCFRWPSRPLQIRAPNNKISFAESGNHYHFVSAKKIFNNTLWLSCQSFFVKRLCFVVCAGCHLNYF